MNDSQLRALACRARPLIAARRKPFLELVSALLRCETVSGDASPAGAERMRAECARCFAVLRAESKRLGLAFREHAPAPGAPPVAAVIEWKGAAPGAGSVGVASHIDVVPAGAGWTRPPFGGEIAEGFIWGRGAQDDKGPTAMALQALEILQALGYRPRRDIRLLIGTQEETGDWSDVDLLIARGEGCDVAITPDGGFPIINGEKGMINLALSARWPAATAAPDRPALVSLRGGERANMVPDRATLTLAAPAQGARRFESRLGAAVLRLAVDEPDARLEICRREKPTRDGRIVFEVTCHGHSAHGSRPDKGHNAALDALRLLTATLDRGDPAAAFAAWLLPRASRIDASGFDCQRAHPHLGKATACLGVVDVSPHGGRAVVNVRFPIGMTRAEIRRRFAAACAAGRATCPGLRVRVEGHAVEPLFVSREEHPEFISALERGYETGAGRPANCHSIGGTTYAKAFPLAVAFGPIDDAAGDREMAHQPDERFAVARHEENILIYALTLALLAGGEAPGSSRHA